MMGGGTYLLGLSDSLVNMLWIIFSELEIVAAADLWLTRHEGGADEERALAGLLDRQLSELDILVRLVDRSGEVDGDGAELVVAGEGHAIIVH